MARSVRHLAPVLSLAVALSAARLFGEVVSRVSFWDGCSLQQNSGGGFAGGGWSNLAPGMGTAGENLCGNRANCTKLWSLHKFSKGYVYNGDYQNYTNHVVNFVGGADIPLDENALLAISNSFVKCRANRGTCIPRFAYTWDGYGGCEPDDFEVILTHIRQLGAVISQFPDVIPGLECGMIGAYGEMHTSRYTGAEHANRILEAWLRNTPASVAVLVRAPAYIVKYAGMTTAELLAAHPGSDGSDFDRLGLYNDGYLGTDYDYGTWSGEGSKTGFTRAQGRAYLAVRNMPYGGEFATVSADYFTRNVHLLDTNRFNLVAEWYDTHLSYLRTIRATDMTVTRMLAANAFSAAEFDFAAMPFLGEYDGVDLRTFCEDHMGARLVVRDVRLVDQGTRARLEMVVENTGFAAFVWPEVVEVVVGDRVRCGLPGGQPLPAGATRLVSVGFEVGSGLPGGQPLPVGLRVPVPLRPFAFANAGAYDEATGVNWVCTAVFDGSGDRDVMPRGWSWWMRANARRDWTRGGAWQAREACAGRPCCSLVAAEPLPAKRGSDITSRVKAGWLAELPAAEIAAPVSFVCLLEDGALVPYGFAAGAWHRLAGPALTEGAEIAVAIHVEPIRRGVRRVSFAVDGAQYVEAGTGRSEFATAFAEAGPQELVVLGAGEAREIQAAAWTWPDAGTKILVR